MHYNEKWQLFYENGEPRKEEWRDADKGNPQDGESDVVGCAAVFLYRRNGKKLEFLWQKRSAFVNNGGKWDYSAGGHVNVAESVTEAAMREAREEIGAEVEASDLQLITVERTYHGMFVWIFLADWTDRPCNFHFDDKEVEAVRWVQWQQMSSFWEKNGKKPLQKRKVVLKLINKWLQMRGLV